MSDGAITFKHNSSFLDYNQCSHSCPEQAQKSDYELNGVERYELKAKGVQNYHANFF